MIRQSKLASGLVLGRTKWQCDHQIHRASNNLSSQGIRLGNIGTFDIPTRVAYRDYGLYMFTPALNVLRW
jgi:hypothetical protein